MCAHLEAREYTRCCVKAPLGLLSEDYDRVKEETEKQSFPDPEELSLSSLLYISVYVSPLHVSHELLRAGVVSLISESPAPDMVIDTELTINT